MADTPNAAQAPLFAADNAAVALERAREDARGCRACPLWEIGTQTVFGAGPADARVMMIGEAPGEQEDREGIPFVGPAGRLFDEGLAQAGLRRDRLWVTNVVKHRPWQWQGRRKKNRAPKTSEIKACRPWLDAELAVIKPRVLVCLGAVAAQGLLGRGVRVTQDRGRPLDSELAELVFVTVHPSSILRADDADRDQAYADFVADLKAVAAEL